MDKMLLDGALSAVNVGVESFAATLAGQGVAALQLDWRPPADGDAAVGWALARLAGDRADPDCAGSLIDAANALAARRMIEAQPVLVDVILHARDVWPDMERTLLHAGAPIAWPDMCGPMQGAMIGAVLYEGWAKTQDEARALLAAGGVRFGSCHDRAAVGPMSGVISPSMPLFAVRNETNGNYAYSNMSEGTGKVLRFGANSSEVLDRLRWIEGVLAPGLKIALAAIPGGIELKPIQSQALLMGDEVHSRNSAATSLFFAAIAVPLVASEIERQSVRQILDFIGANSQFFLNLSMACCKATMDAAHGVEGSSIVTAMSRNGVTTAIRVSGLGSRWFEAASDMPRGLYFPGFSADDANPDLGDSAIAETAGFGGASLAASPALVQLVGGTVTEAVSYSREMYHITETHNPAMSLPLLDFLGSPTGIDVRKVVDTGIRPVITTGIAHREAGVGQIGAGIVRAPLHCFSSAVLALEERYAEGAA